MSHNCHTGIHCRSRSTSSWLCSNCQSDWQLGNFPTKKHPHITWKSSESGSFNFDDHNWLLVFVTESSETVDDRVPKPWNKSVVLAVYNDQNRGIYNSESLEVNIQTKAIDRMSENIQKYIYRTEISTWPVFHRDTRCTHHCNSMIAPVFCNRGRTRLVMWCFQIQSGYPMFTCWIRVRLSE